MNARIKNIITMLATIPEKIVNGVVALINNLVQQFSTPRGLLVGVIAFAFVFDIITLGSFKFVAYSIDVVKNIIAVVKDRWLELLMIGLIITVLKK